MKNQVNKRIIEVKDALNLSEREFCARIDISTGTLHRIKNDLEVTGKTINSLVVNLKVSREWLNSGTGEMFLNSVQTDEKTQNWKETAFDVLKSENEFLKKQLSFTQELMNNLVKQFSKLDFLNGIAELAGITECNSCNTVRVAKNAA